MNKRVAILGIDGQPLKPTRTAALSGGRGGWSGPAYDAADIEGQHMQAWAPFLQSPDTELNPYRDRIVARIRDIVRNDGWASGSVTRMLDNVIGANLRPIAKPDYMFLALESGNKAFDHEWAKEFSAAVDANWRSWANDDLGLYCDVTRNQTFVEMMRVAFRHKLVDGDALAVLHWLPDRISLGRARYATALQLVDPDRLSNPQLHFDMQSTRGGVEVDQYGVAIAYHIRKAHAGDWFAAKDSLTWERIPRETDWGRPIVVHDFDGERAGTHRGGAGVFAPVLQRLKMLAKYDGVELDAAVINSIFAAYIESPFDQELVSEAVDDGERLNAYQATRSEFHGSKDISIGGSRIPILFPGEKINAVAATRPNGANFAAFEGAVLRNVASGLGLSAQQVSNDWSDVNYSSARGALLEAWKTLDRRRDHFTQGFASPIRAAWMEEAFSMGDLPLPKGAPLFLSARAAYARCRWLGPPRGWVDPVAEKQGAVMGMDAALSTLEDECAQQGLVMEEVLEQRSYELKLFEKLGIPLPQWAGQMVTAQEAIKKPETTKVKKPVAE